MPKNEDPRPQRPEPEPARQREPQPYGSNPLAQLESGLQQLAGTLGVELGCLQSNLEGVLIDRIHAAVHPQTPYSLPRQAFEGNFQHGLPAANLRINQHT